MKEVAVEMKQYNSTMTESKGRYYCLCGILLGFFVLYFIYFSQQQNFELARGIFLQLKSSNFTVPKAEDEPTCQFMQFDPMDDSIKHLVKFTGVLSCPKPRPLTYRNGSFLRVDSTLFGQYKVEDPKLLDCCWRKIFRPPVDNNKKDVIWDKEVRTTACQDFKDEVEANEEFVLVECEYKNKTVYKHAHATVVKKLDTDSNVTSNKTEAEVSPPSVLLVAIDSASRLNFYRHMPLTKRALLTAGAVEFLVYNKVGDNTLPNLVPIFTGYSLNDIEKSCWPRKNETFDDCPFIWKNFSAKGYRTMYVEDQPDIGTFNYHKSGFREQPTDHFGRPFFLAADKYVKKTTRNNMYVCYGPSPATEIVLNYTRDFVNAYRDSTYFAVSWSSTLSHQDMNDLGKADRFYVNFFRDAFESGVLNNTIMLFFSDHGMRWGKIRETFIGWLENRVPYLFVWVPPNIRERHPGIYDNLVGNTRTLISPFDVHETLKSILHWDAERGPQRTSATTCEKCYSLFEKVPKNRTCDEASVDEEWCACVSRTPVPTDSPDIQNIASMSVSKVNRIVKSSKGCAQLALKSVVSARTQLLKKQDVNVQEFIVEFSTTPGDAAFEAMGRRSGKTHKISLVGSLNRVNEYGNQSWCVDDFVKKPFCYCN